MLSLIADAYVGPAHKREESMPLLHVFAFDLIAARRLSTAVGAIHVAECGVYKGHSLTSCARLARGLQHDVSFTGLDTFTGLPPLSETDLSFSPVSAALGETPLFSDTSLEQVRAFLDEHAAGEQVTLVPGLFAATLPHLPERQYDFVHMDCDLYEPHLECLEYFYPRVPPGGIVYFDDYHPGFPR